MEKCGCSPSRFLDELCDNMIWFPSTQSLLFLFMQFLLNGVVKKPTADTVCTTFDCIRVNSRVDSGHSTKETGPIVSKVFGQSCYVRRKKGDRAAVEQ